MSTPSVSLPSCRDMLLDAENRDAERVKRELGSTTAGSRNETTPREGTVLLGDGDDKSRKKRKKKKKKRKTAEKS